MEKSRVRILIVDDEVGILEALQTHLEMDGYEVLTASSAQEALEEFKKQKKIHIVLTDINMPNMDGIELLERIKMASANTVVIMITAYTSLMKVANSRTYGASDYLLKPFRDLSEVDAVIDRAYEQITRWEDILAETLEAKKQKTTT
ncbi:MAG: response regulator [Planctomycetota bacterium]